MIHTFRSICALVCGAVILITASARAQSDESGAALRELRGKVRKFTLDNGLRVVLYRRGTAPVFAGSVVVRVGGVDEYPGLTGISHLFEHMAFKGTESIGVKNRSRERVLLEQIEVLEQKRSRGETLSAEDQTALAAIYAELKSNWEVGEFDQYYDKFGGVGLNATTDKEFTKYFVEMPRSAFEFWCWIESERLLHPVMRQFYQERDVVMEERRMRYEDDPQGKLYELLLGSAFTLHPYRYPVIGYASDISRLTANQLEDFRRRYYVPSNMVVSIVGDVNPESDLQIIERYFGKIPKGPSVDHSTAVEPKQEGQKSLTLESHVSPYLMVAYHKPNYPNLDDPPLSMMLEMLGGSKVSPLYTELVLKRQVAIDVGYSEEPGTAYPNLMIFSLMPRAPHTPEQLQAEFDQVIEQFKQSGITAQAMQIAKRATAKEYLGHLQANTSLALDFGSSELLYNDWSELISWYEKAMKVELKDIERVAAKYLVPRSRIVATIHTKRGSK